VSLKPVRTTTTTPVAVLGTIALSLSGTPAHADAVAAETATPALRAAPSVSPAALAAAAGKRVSDRTHTVVRGDTVSGIAARHGLRTADVLAWNGLTWKSIIHPGDVIRLTAKKSSASTTKTASSSSTSSKSGSGTHGVGLSKLLQANDLGPSAIIYPGEKLRIPGAAAVASTTSKPSKSSKPADETTSAAAKAPKVTLDREQVKSVKTIISVGRKRGVPDKGIAIALATAMVESWLRNLDYGTHDSLGLFQQRPSTGWGTPSQVRDPRRSAAVFFGGRSDPNRTATRGLLDIPGWRDMDFGAAAQSVQISAYPHRYGLWEKQAYAWLEAYG
jgi:LysM repeat protein